MGFFSAQVVAFPEQAWVQSPSSLKALTDYYTLCYDEQLVLRPSLCFKRPLSLLQEKAAAAAHVALGPRATGAQHTEHNNRAGTFCTII